MTDRAVMVLPLVEPLTVTQSPAVMADAVRVTVWPNVVELVQVTVVRLLDELCTSIDDAEMEVTEPAVPGRAGFPPGSPARPDGSPVEPLAALVELDPQAARTTTASTKKAFPLAKLSEPICGRGMLTPLSPFPDQEY